MKREGFALLVSVLGAMALIVITGLALSIAPSLLTPQQSAITPTPGGMVVEPARLINDFSLTNQDGAPSRLSDWRGKAVLVFFGYTHCPDVCPLTMADFKAIKQILQTTNPELVEKTVFLMISIDGGRDTPEVMKRYVAAFDPSFIGLTDDPKKVANIALDFGATFDPNSPVEEDTGYQVAHTSFTYLLDTQGRWRMVYPFQTPREIIAKDIERIVRES